MEPTKATMSPNTAKRKRVEEDPKAARSKQKFIRKKRKLSRPYGELIQEAKEIYSLMLEDPKMTSKKRSSLIEKLMAVITGHIRDVALKSDGSRIVQYAVKYGTPKHRTQIYEETKTKMHEIARSTYSHYLVRKLIKYGDSRIRNAIIRSFNGYIVKMMKQKSPSDVVEYAFLNYCNARQKASIIEEFYGRTYALNKRPQEKRTLETILKANPEEKEHIINYMKETIITIAGKGTILMSKSVIHTVLLKFFEIASHADRIEIITALTEHVLGLISTRNGAQVACLCVAYGTNKHRKDLIRAMRTHVVQVCGHPYGHFLVLRILNTVDDTVLVRKLIFSEMKASIGELIVDKYGRLPFLFLLRPDKRRYFPPIVLKLLETVYIPSADDPEKMVPSAKKDDAKRRSEHLKNIFSDLFDKSLDMCYDLATSYEGRDLLLEVATFADDEQKQQLFKEILTYVCLSKQEKKELAQAMDEKVRVKNPFMEYDSAVHDLMTHSCAHLFLRWLIRDDESGKFAGMIYDKIAALNDKMNSRMITYLSNVHSSWVIVSLHEKDNTSKQIAEFVNANRSALELFDQKNTAVKTLLKNIKS